MYTHIIVTRHKLLQCNRAAHNTVPWLAKFPIREVAALPMSVHMCLYTCISCCMCS